MKPLTTALKLSAFAFALSIAGPSFALSMYTESTAEEMNKEIADIPACQKAQSSANPADKMECAEKAYLHSEDKMSKALKQKTGDDPNSWLASYQKQWKYGRDSFCGTVTKSADEKDIARLQCLTRWNQNRTREIMAMKE